MLMTKKQSRKKSVVIVARVLRSETATKIVWMMAHEHSTAATGSSPFLVPHPNGRRNLKI